MKNLSSPLLLAFLLAWACASAAEKVDINTASYEELQKIKWVGKVIAQRIIEARPFYSVDELVKVNGIAEKKLADIKAEGLAWVDPNLRPAPEPAQKTQPEPELPLEPSGSAPQTSEPGTAPRAKTAEPLGKGLAAAAEPIRQGYSGQQSRKPLPVFLIALAFAAFSGIAILILKNKLENTYNKNV